MPGLDGAAMTSARPVAPQILPMLVSGEVVFEILAGRAAIDVLLRQVDEVLLAETALRFRS